MKGMAVMRQEELEIAQQVVEDTLREHVKSAKFDPIVLRPDYGAYGDEIIDIAAVCDDDVFDDEENGLNTRETVKVVWHLMVNLRHAGTDAFPVTSFYPRSEWEELCSEQSD